MSGFGAPPPRRFTVQAVNISQRKQLASLLADRVKDKADRNDTVGMFTTARLLDQVNEEIAELEAESPAEKPPATGRRVFVEG